MVSKYAIGGEASFRFQVPTQVEQGAARFVATITDGGIVETEMKPFVVPTGRVLVVYEGFTEPAEYYPSVIGAEWIDREDRPADA